MRKVWPSMIGFSPKFEERIALSTACTTERSQTCTESMRGSGTLTLAT